MMFFNYPSASPQSGSHSFCSLVIFANSSLRRSVALFRAKGYCDLLQHSKGLRVRRASQFFWDGSPTPFQSGSVHAVFYRQVSLLSPNQNAKLPFPPCIWKWSYVVGKGPHTWQWKRMRQDDPTDCEEKGHRKVKCVSSLLFKNYDLRAIVYPLLRITIRYCMFKT